MKKTAKAKLQEELQEYKRIVDGVLDELTEEKIISLLIEKREDDIDYIQGQLDDDRNYIKYETDSYRSQKDDARSRLPYYKKQIKQNKDVIKQLASLEKTIKKLSRY